MINSIVDTFINLEDDKKDSLFSYVKKFIKPIKIYLAFILLLILIMCVSNFLILKNIKMLIPEIKQLDS
jgi:hypothetical protein